MAEQEITTVIEDGFIYDFVPNSFGYDSAGDSGQGVPQWYGSAEGDYPDMNDPLVETIIDEYIEEGAQPEEAEVWANTAARKLRDAETFEGEVFGELGQTLQMMGIFQMALAEQTYFVYVTGSGPYKNIILDCSGSMMASIGYVKAPGKQKYHYNDTDPTRTDLSKLIILEGISEGLIDEDPTIIPWGQQFHRSNVLTGQAGDGIGPSFQFFNEDDWDQHTRPMSGTDTPALQRFLQSQSDSWNNHTLLITDDDFAAEKITECSVVLIATDEIITMATRRIAERDSKTKAGGRGYDVAALDRSKRRSAAAKKGWETRRKRAGGVKNSEEFEAPMAVFPAGKHDISTSKDRLKAKLKKSFKLKRGTKPIYLTLREGSSNKFHVFMETDEGNFNVYGRIGYAKPQVAGPLSSSAYQTKLRNKIRKGYQKTAYSAEQYGAEEASLPYAEVGVPVVPNSWGGDSALTSGYGVPQWYGSAEHESAFDELEDSIEQQYLDKGYSHERAEKIAGGAAYNIGVRAHGGGKKGKAWMERAAKRGRRDAEHQQGYDDRDDESIGMRHRGHHKQSLKDRRDESKGMEKSMGHRPYSDVGTMDMNAQGYDDRDDESIGMRHRGPHTQNLKDRRDESKGMTDALNLHHPYSDVSTMEAHGYKDKREQAVTEEAMSDVEYLREQYAAEKMGLVAEDYIRDPATNKKMYHGGKFLKPNRAATPVRIVQPFKTGAWATAGVVTAAAGITVLSAIALGMAFRSE